MIMVYPAPVKRQTSDYGTPKDTCRTGAAVRDISPVTTRSRIQRPDPSLMSIPAARVLNVPGNHKQHGSACL